MKHSPRVIEWVADNHAVWNRQKLHLGDVWQLPVHQPDTRITDARRQDCLDHTAETECVYPLPTYDVKGNGARTFDSIFFSLFRNSESSGEVVSMRLRFWTMILANSRSWLRHMSARYDTSKQTFHVPRPSPVSQRTCGIFVRY
jgi:hypothetical protein